MKKKTATPAKITGLALRLKKMGAFWSYQPEALTSLPEDVLIEECLRWGDVPELNDLFALFPLANIRKVWREKMLPDLRVYPHNYYLAMVFFNIKNPKRYILPLQNKNSRYARLQSLAS